MHEKANAPRTSYFFFAFVTSNKMCLSKHHEHSLSHKDEGHITLFGCMLNTCSTVGKILIEEASHAETLSITEEMDAWRWENSFAIKFARLKNS